MPGQIQLPSIHVKADLRFPLIKPQRIKKQNKTKLVFSVISFYSLIGDTQSKNSSVFLMFLLIALDFLKHKFIFAEAKCLH